MPFLFSSMIFVRSRAMLKMTMSSTMMIPPSEQPIAVDAEEDLSRLPLSWLSSVPTNDRCYWAEPAGERCRILAGVGAADVVAGRAAKAGFAAARKLPGGAR